MPRRRSARSVLAARKLKGDARELRVLVEKLERAVAVEHGHHDVIHHQIGAGGQRRFDSYLTVLGHQDGVAANLQNPARIFLNVAVIFSQRIG